MQIESLVFVQSDCASKLVGYFFCARKSPLPIVSNGCVQQAAILVVQNCRVRNLEECRWQAQGIPGYQYGSEGDDTNQMETARLGHCTHELEACSLRLVACYFAMFF